MENNLRFASASVSDRGLSDKRPVNEDSYLELAHLGLFAVADGVGGAQAGDFASQMAMETLAEAFNNLPENFDAEQALRIAIQHANQSIFNMSNELPQLASMATTIAALHLNDNIATIAHVGDSRIYRIEPDGTLQRETADHSVVEEEVRAGRMTPEQALVHPSRNVISRALGAEEIVEIDIKTIMVEPGTMFLLCSDGITRHIDDNEIEQLFQNELDPAALTDQMKEICYSRGAEDNLTAVVVRLSIPLSDSFVPPQAAEAFPPIEEVEEDTIATARSPFDERIEDTPIQEIEVEQPPTHGVSEESEQLDDEGYLLDEPLGTPVVEEEAREYSSASLVVPATDEVATEPPRPEIEDAAPFTYGNAEQRSGRWGSFFTSALLFLLGGVAGFAALWFWQQYNPPPQVPVLNETKSNNIPLTAFEEARREVDKAPERYLAANAATPQDAEDHYLLARAQLLTGKYVEAKRQFLLAKERLSDVDATNSATLAAEIAMGSAIADNPAVAEAFAKEIAAGVQPPTAANVNSNVNANPSIR